MSIPHTPVRRTPCRRPGANRRPRIDTGELDVARAFLGYQRHCVLKKAEGLTEEQLRRRLVGRGTSILGLVRHLAETERGWFRHHLAGGERPGEAEPGATVPLDRSAAEVLDDHRAAIEESDRAIEAAGDPEAFLAIPVDGHRMSLRRLLAHMTAETARHAGNTGVLRERIDGATGR
ncbi:DinB family protein [Lentzea sp. NPDC060358]|uniref:DinB family protein n=1 Tax=Lentzea sp. NPDC060358 TaxID=3347103 RepID=UPI00366375A2